MKSESWASAFFTTGMVALIIGITGILDIRVPPVPGSIPSTLAVLTFVGLMFVVLSYKTNPRKTKRIKK